MLFDAQKIIENNGNNALEEALITSVEVFGDLPIKCMDYNPFKPSLLAVASKEVYIVNFEKGFENTEIYTASSSQEENMNITSVQWNRSKNI